MGGALAAGLLVGLSAAILSGSAAMLVMETSERRGLRVASAAGAGIASGDAVWAAVVVVAGTILHRLMAPWAAALQWTGVCVVLVIWVFAVRKLIRFNPAADESVSRLPASPGRVYLTFLAFTLVDAVTVVFFLSIIVGAAPAYRATEAAAFVGGALLASLGWQCGAAVTGRRRGAFSAGARKTVLLIDVVLLAIFVGCIAFGLYRP